MRFAVLFVLAACACASARVSSSSSTRGLVVDASAPVGGDGSPGRPFASLSDALAASRDGHTIQLAPGTYTGPFPIDRAVSIVGDREAVLTADTDVVEIAAPARLVGISLHGVVGARAMADAVFEDVAFADQLLTGLLVEKGRTEVDGGRVESQRE